MSVKKTDPELLRDDGPVKFVSGKESRFQPDLSGRRGYYTAVKHLKFGISAQNKFLQDFSSQVVPLQLPGMQGGGGGQLPVQTGYLVSEVGFYLLTEDNNKMIEE